MGGHRLAGRDVQRRWPVRLVASSFSGWAVWPGDLNRCADRSPEGVGRTRGADARDDRCVEAPSAAIGVNRRSHSGGKSFVIARWGMPDRETKGERDGTRQPETTRDSERMSKRE
jgi:hypothetical protein